MCTTQPIKDTAQLKRFKEYYLLQKPNPRNHMLIVIGLNSALRISDILGLTYGDIYHYEKDAWKTHLTVTEQKTGKERSVAVNASRITATTRIIMIILMDFICASPSSRSFL